MRSLFVIAAALAFAGRAFGNSFLSVAVLPPPEPLPNLAAKAYLLADLSGHQTLLAANAQARREPSSLTKLMTAYVVLRTLKDRTINQAQMVKVSEKAWKVEGARMFIAPNKAVTVDELLHGVIVESANDASVALAEVVSGSETAFVERMNKTAVQLGMTNTHFANSTGLSDPQQYASAYDLALLAAAIIDEFPDSYLLYSNKEFRYQNLAQYNRNRLLWTDPYVDGMAASHSDSGGGFSMIASAKRGQRRLLAVVLDASSDMGCLQAGKNLLDIGFQSYDAARLYDVNQPIATIAVWKGVQDSLKAGFLKDQYVTLPKGQIDQLQLTVVPTKPLFAPIERGQQVGSVKASFTGRPLGEYPLYALEEVAGASWVGQAWDTLRLMFSF